MASTSASKSFLQAIQNRRTIYHLSDKQILPDEKILKLVQQAVREAPSSFNVQSSRVVILLGEQHKKYWLEIVPEALHAAKGDKVKGGGLSPEAIALQQMMRGIHF